MDEFKQVILNFHQIFIGLLVLSYSVFCLADLKDIKESSTVVERRNVVLICLGIFVGSFIALYNTWGQGQGLFFVAEFSILITLSLIRPKYAVGFFVFLLLYRPLETFDNQMMSSMPRDISYLAILSVGCHKIISRDFYFRFNFGTLMTLLFGLWMLLSAIVAPHSEVAVEEYMNILSKGIIVFILIQNSLKKVNDFKPLKTALVFGILEKCCVSFYQSYFMGDKGIDVASERLVSVGILSNSNDIAAIFVLAVPFCLFYILKSNLRPFHWPVAIISVGIMSTLIWQAQSRGAVLGLAAALGSYALVKVTNKRTLGFIGAGCFLVALLIMGKMSRSASDLGESQSNRIVFMKAGVNMAIRNPLFGVGFWGFNENLSSYIVDGDSSSEKKMSAHSSWVLALAEGGFIGLFSFLGIWIYAFLCSWRIRILEPEYLMAIIGYGVTCTFLSHTYLLYPYILLAIIITHFHILKENEQLPQ
jgi:hypothetical protein